MDREYDHPVISRAQTLLYALNLVLDRVCDCDFAGDLYGTVLEGDVDPAETTGDLLFNRRYKAVLLSDPLYDLLQVPVFALRFRRSVPAG